MQRIEADAGRPDPGGNVDELREIAEIPDAPVALRPQPVELHRERPHAPMGIALIGALGGNQERGFLAAFVAMEPQPIGAERQVMREPKILFFDGPRCHPAVVGQYLPAQACRRRPGQEDTRLTILADENGGRQPSPLRRGLIGRHGVDDLG